MQKVFANDKWKYSSRDNKEGRALPPDNESGPSRVRTSQNIATSLVVVTSYILEKSKAIYGQDKLYAAKGGGWFGFLAGQKKHKSTIQSKAGPWKSSTA